MTTAGQYMGRRYDPEQPKIHQLGHHSKVVAEGPRYRATYNDLNQAACIAVRKNDTAYWTIPCFDKEEDAKSLYDLAVRLTRELYDARELLAEARGQGFRPRPRLEEIA